MNDSFITSINAQKTTMDWIEILVQNMSNAYTPGYREIQGNFKTCLDGVSIEEMNFKTGQGKSMPGTSPENVFLEGEGFFVVKNKEGNCLYTRLGEFTFDGEGNYKAKNGGFAVQGYILNDNGEVMANQSTQKPDPHSATAADGGPGMMATTDIKLWMDPTNGKYLGKYDEYEIKEDGIIYGKADKGKTVVPLYKIAIMTFQNPEGLTKARDGYYMENKDSGKPVMGRGEVRSGLLEMSNVNFKEEIAYLQQAKLQLEVTNKLINTNKQLLEEAIRLLG